MYKFVNVCDRKIVLPALSFLSEVVGELLKLFHVVFIDGRFRS